MKALFYGFCMFCLSASAMAQHSYDSDTLLNLYQQRNYSAALGYLERFADSSLETSPALLSQLAYASQAAGHYQEAEEYYNELLQRDSSDIRILGQLGALYSRQGKIPEAVGTFRKVLSLDSLSIPTLQSLAAVYEESGEREQLLKTLEEANKINPSHADISYELASLYLASKRYQEADSIVQLSQDSSRHLIRIRVQALYGRKQYSEVVSVGVPLLEGGDKSELLIQALAPSYYMMRNYKACIDLYREMEDAGFELNESALYYVAMSYKHLKRWPEADAYIQKTIETAISPNTAHYYFEKAGINENRAHFITALSAYQKSLQFKISPSTYYAMGVLYDYRLGKPTEAKRYYRLFQKNEKDEESNRTYLDFVASRLKEIGN